MMNRVIVMAAASAFAVRGAAAKCAMTELEPALITDKAATMPGDGGVLVGYKAEVERNSQADGDPSVVTWKFSVDTDHVTLAPGLTVYRPKAGATVAITDGKGAAIAKFARDAKAPALVLPAPMPGKLVIESFRSGRGSRRELTATLSVPPPDTAVAVILYSAKAAKALSYGRVVASAGGGKTVVPWSDPPRCSFAPPGTAAPVAGDKLVLAWVDQFGRVGKTSAPIGFSEIKGTKDDDD